MNRAKAIVIGAGTAGMTCAARLAERGISVILLEKLSKPGGKMISVNAPELGFTPDNGFKLIIGAYREFLSFVDLIGSSDKLHKPVPFSCSFAFPDGRVARFDTSKLPGEAGSLWGLLCLSSLTIAEKIKIVRFAAGLNRNQPARDETAAEYLRSSWQTDSLIGKFWSPLVVSALNTRIEIASAKILHKVLKEGFFAPGDSSKAIFASAPFDEIFRPLETFLEARNSLLVTGFDVKSIEFHADKATVLSADNRELTADLIVSALPFDALSAKLKCPVPDSIAKASRIAHSPIVSAYLKYDRLPKMPTAVSFPFSPVHWAFDCSAFIAERKNTIAVTVSAADEVFDMSSTEIIRMADREIRKHLPNFTGSAVIAGRVFKDRRATHLCDPENEKLRPGAETEIPRLILAGDKTSTGLPSTLESAAVSGSKAALLAEAYLNNIVK